MQIDLTQAKVLNRPKELNNPFFHCGKLGTRCWNLD